MTINCNHVPPKCSDHIVQSAGLTPPQASVWLQIVWLLNWELHTWVDDGRIDVSTDHGGCYIYAQTERKRETEGER
jgi:hypothetical protein